MPRRWNNAANLRKRQIESGLDITFSCIFMPIFVKLIKEAKPHKVLEIGAGTGHISKELSKFDFEIVALEPSDGMYKVANQVLLDSGVSLLRSQIEDLDSSKKFEVIFSHMVAHVIDNIDEFFKNISMHLYPNSTFIFSIPHPCFYNSYKKILDDNTYNYMNEISQEISFSISKDKENLITNVPYHHRPLSFYINTLSKNKLILKKLVEIYPTDEIQMLYGSFWHEPRYCLFICEN
ncbi:methyltransferase [Legionella beliardensis]|uniref:Methyltransferase n=1 Tax=Legionella beliardensis TaxID=91822 RepID=A0A378I7T8_9GAMM|nr:class I SAM-dependent methyltransferase [Legionella beliardensis]STX28464.1 methyltransferase [Legionella beliardensis]